MSISNDNFNLIVDILDKHTKQINHIKELLESYDINLSDLEDRIIDIEDKLD